MSLHVWIAYVLTEAVLSLTPGPAVLFVSSHGMRDGLSSGVRAGAGIVAGNSVYFALSGLGLGAVITASSTLFTIVRWTGAAYLIFLGVRMIVRRRDKVDAEAPSSRRPFARGVFVQLSNPKALLFFTALLPQFVSRGPHVAQQFVIIGLTSILVEFPILALYAFAADRSRRMMRGRFERLRERIAGSFLALTGARLAALRAR